VIEAELRQAAHGDAVFLIRPRELEPELTLGHRCGCAAARNEDPQGLAALAGELLHAGLERAELSDGAAREDSLS
jgi:hypothetical protein